MNIVLDAMGGDNAPEEIIQGGLDACSHIHGDLIFVGDAETIQKLLPNPVPKNVKVVHASQVVEMDEKPLEAYRKKKDSSMMVGIKLVKDGKAGAFVSAGSTGSASATALLTWRQVTGIHRPAIGSQLPNHHGGFVMLDAGASPDVDPEHLVEFAILGRAYAEKVMGRKNPKVHLINIGEEPGKGNAFAKQSFKLLSKFEWFAGNIEGKDMFNSPCDVVVCEAFVGNVVLKTAEGVAEMFAKHIRAGVPDNFMKSLYWPVKKVMAPIRKHMDYAEVGGSPLLGLNGICVIAHGRSNAKAIRNAVLMADKAIRANLVDTIRDAVRRDLGESTEEVKTEEHE
ncbi:MAG: phosphate acyltransferase PlsX [Armatimonadetes bacterium]|nr:phosphate acyltransferase PlsX [Armatimonadota bacterium]